MMSSTIQIQPTGYRGLILVAGLLVASLASLVIFQEVIFLKAVDQIWNGIAPVPGLK